MSKDEKSTEETKEIIDRKELSRTAKGAVMEILEVCRNPEYKNIPLLPGLLPFGEAIWKDGHHRGWLAGMEHAKKMVRESG